MKKKLLITLGCSYTEGMGCYDYTKFPKDKHIFSNDISPELIDYQRNRFHELGWPNRLGKKLGYDKVLNLGWSGSSPSGNLKHFFQNYWEDDFNGWDVFIFWWVPFSHRISFYTNGCIEDVVGNFDDGSPIDNLGKAYAQFTNDLTLDSLLETNFYLKMMVSYCQKKNFNFLWFIESSYFNEKYTPLLITQNKFNHSPFDSIVLVKSDSEMLNEVDLHPNEKGYEFLAEKFYSTIEKEYPYLINQNPPNEIEWEWKGKPQQIKLPNEN